METWCSPYHVCDDACFRYLKAKKVWAFGLSALEEAYYERGMWHKFQQQELQEIVAKTAAFYGKRAVFRATHLELEEE